MQWKSGPAAGFTTPHAARFPTATTAPTWSTSPRNGPTRLAAQLVRAADPAPQVGAGNRMGDYHVIGVGNDAVFSSRSTAGTTAGPSPCTDAAEVSAQAVTQQIGLCFIDPVRGLAHPSLLLGCRTVPLPGDAAHFDGVFGRVVFELDRGADARFVEVLFAESFWPVALLAARFFAGRVLAVAFLAGRFFAVNFLAEALFAVAFLAVAFLADLDLGGVA
jgi:hypothetical protein